MAIFTLRDLIASPGITVGGVTLSQITNNGPTNINTAAILIETVEGSDPGIDISLDPRFATTSAAAVGIQFVATVSGATLHGATMHLDGYGFAAPETGGQATADLTQGRRVDDNIGINLRLDNNPGAPDTLSGADAITGGPVDRFTFEYDMALNGAGTVGTTEIRFDLDGSGGGGGGGQAPNFDGLQYIASYSDLIAAFGANAAAGEQHFLSNGQAEGRQADLFSETQYLRNYGDLQAAFGTNVNGATSHYITNGFAEGRVDDAPSPAQIDGLQYIASSADLIAAFGANAAAGQQHYASNGQAEGRVLDNFNETQYLANYADLQAAFGTNGDLATQHFITNGFAEGRTDFLI